MVQVTGEKNLFLFSPPGCARYGRLGECVFPGRMLCFDFGMQQDLFARCQPVLKLPCFAQRDHESEGPGGRKTADMSPSDQPVVLLPPGGSLVRRVGDDPGSAVSADGEVDDVLRLTGRQHQLAAQVGVPVILLGCTCADIHEKTGRFPAKAVLSQAQGHGVPVGKPPDAHRPSTRAFDFPELGKAGIPRGSRFLRTEHRLPVRRVATNCGFFESVLFQFAHDVRGRGVELTACAHAMLECQGIEIALCFFPGNFRRNLQQYRIGNELTELGPAVRSEESKGKQQEGGKSRKPAGKCARSLSVPHTDTPDLQEAAA
jgi:hypothetical protein